jgi:serine/threonine-protein kinase
LLFGFSFLVANYLPPVFDPRARLIFESFARWGPGAISITVSLVVAGLTLNRSLSPSRVMDIGLVFGVVGAYGIAFASYWGIYQGLVYEPAHLDGFGPGYVAPWIIAFIVLIPARPLKSFLAAVLAATAVPVTMLLTMAHGGTSIVLAPGNFFTALILPYLLVIIMALVGARVVHSLGSHVRRAREMGNYQLIERLGVGGMGEVWRAQHRLLARPAAVKLVRAKVMYNVQSGDSSLALQRFEREAQTTALLRSPHTIQLYDYGVADNGTFYYVMELLDGLDLQQLVGRYGPLPAERVVHLLCQVCDSLAEAHEHGLIHRDIKAANIYVCRYARAVDFVKVLDFGLVKWRAEQWKAADLTVNGMVGGTPAYMAPEQINGGVIDERTDIYALGCVGYWLLTGATVFESETPLGLIAQHAEREPVPPSRRCGRDIPRAMDGLILQCLAKDPDTRPQSVDALADALGSCAGVGSWTAERAREWWDVHHPPDIRRSGNGSLETPVMVSTEKRAHKRHMAAATTGK